MKRICLFTAFITLCTLIMTGCEKDPAAGLAKSKTMMIKASIYNPINEGKALWLEGDNIRIFSNQDVVGIEFVAKEGGLPKISFIGPVTEGDQFYGIHPYSLEGAFDGSSLSLQIPVQQPASFWPMAGKGTKETGMDFKGVGALLSLNMVGQGIVSTVKVEGTDADGNTALFSGPGKVDMNTDFPVLQIPAGGESYVERVVDLALNNEAKKVYVLIPPGNYQSLNITLTSSIGETFSKEEALVNLTAEQILNINMDVDFQAVAQPVDPDLSIAGLANCYVVPMEGEYSFATKLINNTVLSGDGADFLWTDVAYEWTSDNSEIQSAVSPQNAEYIIKNIAYDAQEGRISFTATGNVGNAVIALYNTTGGTRTIVWSWHIWVAGKSTDQMKVDWVSKNLAAKSQSLAWLDRNIGAINTVGENVGASGLLYQWGRKDPFVGSRLLRSSGTEPDAFGDRTLPVYTNPDFGSGFSVENTLVSISEVVKNPMVFYSSGGNWATDIPTTAWGDDVAPFSTYAGYLDGTDAIHNYTHSIRNGLKSIYDPCPPGYRVATSDEMWLSFTSVWGGTGGIQYPAWPDNVSSTGSSSTNSRIVTDYNDPSISIVLPKSGHRDGGKLASVGTAAYYWTSTINPENNYAFRNVVGATEIRVDAGGSFAIARPLRCVAE
ncbi:hypothetical protein G5B30_07730 [Sphingobacterium sp. SGG-5]|uniref:hypothetical protein n=1 Tax=Sphingobacterium sp. SGG-5 TaxID=2710881 RepID=UPI0013E9B7E2|nr:hypothetical protein [Sphingobacterium sp. SGG-5]NGM61803.1 hypothetical protein [Sphingobacterium sp. SGG-5]